MPPIKKLLLGLAYGGWAVEALNPGCAPGGNFDMRYWNLQLPIGTPGNPTTISSRSLQGCGGYQNFDYFFTESSDGALVMKVPGSPQSAGCVTTPHSLHCRTELREVEPDTGRTASWDPNQPVNRLFARLACPQPGEGTGTVIGQIHIDDAISSKPVAELYYNANGDLSLGVEQTRAGGNQLTSPAGHIPVGQTFTYEIRYESNVLSVSINGANAQVFSTYQLDAPRSYFKAGNYLQGSTPSDVHFFEIKVTHDTTPVVPAWPPAGATDPRSGIGPFNIIAAVDHTLASVPPSTPTGSCDPAAPAIASDNTVTLKLFSGSDCCSSVETIKMGTLDSCHNADGLHEGPEVCVGSNMFDRGIHILTYEGTDCTGSSQSSKLTNGDQCFKNSNSLSTPFKSFKISATGAATCPPKQPAVASDTTVSLNLYSDSGCCTFFEDIKLGTLNACHDANNLPTGFKSFTQAVGSAMFGKGVHIVTYTGKGCTGTATVTKLTNSATCYDNANSINTPFLSFKIADTDSNPECTTPKQPDNDSDDTVTVSFFGETGCCSDPVETAKIGKFGVCHNADKPFKGTTQAVGKNLFGRNIHIRQYASRDCSDRAWAQISLSNKDLCYFGSGQYQSFMISDDDGGSSGSGSGSCNSAPPTKKSDTTVVLELFKETTCCTPVETAAIGKLDVCHNADAPFQAIKQAVGQDMFGKGTHIQLFTSTNCADATWAQADLSNKDICLFGSDTYRSFRVASSPASTTPSQPVDPPPSCTSVTPVPASDDLLQLELYSDEGCCKPSRSWGILVPDSGNFGCLTPPDGSRFSSLSQGVGHNLFGRNILLYLYQDQNCADSQFWVTELTNTKECDTGAPSGGWGSFRIGVKGSSSNTGGGGGGGGGGASPPEVTCHIQCAPVPPVQNCICICSDDIPRNPADGYC